MTETVTYRCSRPLRYHRHSWSDLDERDDPSWLPATGQWTENGRITLDVDGVREFGDTNA
ncbi:hypothetical protein [Micromonospora orduensis]|uniref:hypothetical protein n=1 Tax=Micromonospora orduensis TaxID=1420891 RepID=UPI001ABF0831|nr:hypothetical protein [Micromonospora orduensis]